MKNNDKTQSSTERNRVDIRGITLMPLAVTGGGSLFFLYQFLQIINGRDMMTGLKWLVAVICICLLAHIFLFWKMVGRFQTTEAKHCVQAFGILAAVMVTDVVLAAAFGAYFSVFLTPIAVIPYVAVITRSSSVISKKDCNDEAFSEEIAFIRGQINPHFVFNSLNTVIAISRYDEEEARDLLITLSHYLRRSFDFAKSRPWVSLVDEISYLNAYLEIERARFEERVNVQVNVDAGDGYLIPKMILQPLVENALVHGIFHTGNGSAVTVDITEEKEDLLIQVKDEGPGMSLEQIATAMSNYSDKGICIGNINRRLQRLTGSPLDISSVPGEGTTVCWRIPKKEVFDDQGSDNR